MDMEQYRALCIGKPGATEGFPFDETTLVFKVGGKMFAMLGLDTAAINLKCDPEKAVDLRERYSFVTPGYHMDKKHWNTVDLTLAPDALVKEWTGHSYDLVVSKLPKRIDFFGEAV